ncbi:hypothetical protein ABH19_04605 [Leptospirillum sp. Group II 'CF-1']|nr:hypothetical protein ABH19_04605 [Leptospirillum sp. Group II 'CF-1']
MSKASGSKSRPGLPHPQTTRGRTFGSPSPSGTILRPGTKDDPDPSEGELRKTASFASLQWTRRP